MKMTMPIMLPTIIPTITPILVVGFAPVTSLGPIDAMYNEIIYSPHIPVDDPVEVVADGVGVGTCEVVIEVTGGGIMTMVDINAGNEAGDMFSLMSNTST